MNTRSAHVDRSAELLLRATACARRRQARRQAGLWEITSTHQITGIPPMPKEWQDKVTPEQRAAMETAFKKEAEKGPQTDTDRECITKQRPSKPFDVGEQGLHAESGSHDAYDAGSSGCRATANIRAPACCA
jgi:hypothetical protein